MARAEVLFCKCICKREVFIQPLHYLVCMLSFLKTKPTEDSEEIFLRITGGFKMTASKSKKNKYEIDMCNGTVLDKLISFSIPLMLSSILQLLFNAVDIVVVGRFSGSRALAAVGSTTALINVFTNLFIGVSLGANVLAARFYATKQEKQKKRALHRKNL